MTFDIPTDPDEETPDWLKNLQSGGESVDPSVGDLFSDQPAEDMPDRVAEVVISLIYEGQVAAEVMH